MLSHAESHILLFADTFDHSGDPFPQVMIESHYFVAFSVDAPCWHFGLTIVALAEKKRCENKLF